MLNDFLENRFIRSQPTIQQMQSSENIVIRERNFDAAYFSAFVLMVGFLLISNRGVIRLLIIMCMVCLVYTLGSTLAAHVYLPRYGFVLTPVYALFSAIFFWHLRRKET